MGMISSVDPGKSAAFQGAGIVEGHRVAQGIERGKACEAIRGNQEDAGTVIRVGKAYQGVSSSTGVFLLAVTLLLRYIVQGGMF